MKWKAEAMDRLRRYEAMKAALYTIPEEIDRLEMAARAMRRADPETVSAKGSGSRREDALINNLMERQELEWSLEQVKRWLVNTERGLCALTRDERLVLQRLYLTPQSGAMEQLCSELGMEQSSVYRKRDQALHTFTTAMYGFMET